MTITIRRGTAEDTRPSFDVFVAAMAKLVNQASPEQNPWADPEFAQQWWRRRRTLFEHLTATADLFWVAEQAGRVVGFARSTLQDGVRELTEFFVLPESQSAGIGRELLARAFPSGDTRQRVILATTDVRAQARYLKAGVVPRFPFQYLTCAPRIVYVRTDLTIRETGDSVDTRSILAGIDQAVLGCVRSDDHDFLLGDRQVCVYERNGIPVGYGYLGHGTGPIALLDPGDFPAILAHAERSAAERGDTHIGFNVPMISRSAVAYLLDRGYRIDDYMMLLMSDTAFGRYENYIITDPPLFL